VIGDPATDRARLFSGILCNATELGAAKLKCLDGVVCRALRQSGHGDKFGPQDLGFIMMAHWSKQPLSRQGWALHSP